jgi:hypothetical protein
LIASSGAQTSAKRGRFVGASPYLPEAVKKVFFDELEIRLRKEFIDPTHRKSEGHAAFKDVLEKEGGLLSELILLRTRI